jgi:hypothetical protein
MMALGWYKAGRKWKEDKKWKQFSVLVARGEVVSE